MATREQVIAEARTWLGTPYRHQGNVKGLACDCVNLVNEVLIAVGAVERRPLPAYRTRPNGRLREQVATYLTKIPKQDALPGDILLMAAYRNEDSHLALLTGPDTMIHAFIANRKVVEHSIDARWWSYVTTCFRADGVE